MLHHAFVQTHPEPTSQRYITKPRAVRFSSHTSVLNFAGTAFHVTPRMWANPSWTNVPRHTTSHTSRFELCRNNSEQMTPRMCANPEPTFQRYTTKPQTVRFSSHTSVLNFAGAAPHVTPHMWANPSWTNVPRHTTNFRSENFHLKHPWFELCRNRLHHACVPTHPEPTFQRHTKKPQTPRFSSHTSLFWTLPEQLSILHHACEPTHPEPTSQDTLQTSDPIFLISHIPVLNFAGTARHVTPRMWANPSCTNVPRYTTND